MNQQELDKALDQVKTTVFIGTHAAFLGSLMCSTTFEWSDAHETAWTDGLRIGWNPKDFKRCSPEERKATLLHELWHIAFLHGLRRGNRDPKLWNIAGDYRINNNLIADGFNLPKNGWWVFDRSIDQNGILAEEEIYDLLLKNAIKIPVKPMDDLKDGGDLTGPQANQVVAAVVRAVQAAEVAGQAGKLPGNLKKVLNTFLEPQVPWRSVLAQWMTDFMDSDEYTWRRRNRRFQDVYMPSRQPEDGRLAHLAYIQDTSGSITEKNMIRFNSEVRYVQEVLRPEKLTLVQFDTEITHIRVFNEGELFEDVKMHGGGGTDLRPVREWIEQNKPTAAIVFSDLECDPMEPLTVPIPMIWAVVTNYHYNKPGFGKVIQVTD